MTCKCIEVMDEKLAERNSKLEIGFTFGFEGRPSYTFPALRTEKINKKNRDKVSVIPTFCPFCGTKKRGSRSTPPSPIQFKPNERKPRCLRQ